MLFNYTARDDTAGFARALTMLAPYLQKDLLTVASEIAGSIKSIAERSEALAGLAPHLSEPERGRAISNALSLIEHIEKSWRRVPILQELAPYLTPRQLETAVSIARRIEPRSR
jgi:hypothetical protein